MTDSSCYRSSRFLNAKTQHSIKRVRYWVYSSNQKASLQKPSTGVSTTLRGSSDFILTQFWCPLQDHSQVLNFVLHTHFPKADSVRKYRIPLFFNFVNCNRLYSLDWFFWFDYLPRGLHKGNKPSGYIYVATVFLF